VRLRVAIPEDFTGMTAKTVDVPVATGEALVELAFAVDAQAPLRASVELHAESERDGLPVYAQTGLRLERQRESRPADRRDSNTGR
jgi:hypothetical protein